MRYASINPYNNQLLKEFDFSPLPDLKVSEAAFAHWSSLPVQERCRQLAQVAMLLDKNKQHYARLITTEMGKPLREAVYEIEKSITAFEYYLQYAPVFLQPQPMASGAAKSYARFDPLGIIFSIMPWNFPFWQVFRFAVPTLVSGNVTILKHAPSVPQCAQALEELFHSAGLRDGVFKNYFLTNDDAAALIADPRIAGISFTGSDTTGSLLASLAGRAIKKCVMELGGNDAFIVLPDADIAQAVSGAVKSRSINTGQACNGAKRFIVLKEVAQQFTHELIAQVQQLKPGNPLSDDVQVAPLARKDLAEKVKVQVATSIQQGAVPHWGQPVPDTGGNFVQACVLTNVTEKVLSFNEEIFGPVWSIIVADSEEQALQLANQSVYGLAASVWTADSSKAEAMAARLQAGNVFINDIVKSDPRLPFGGVKRSGFGRELSEYGLKEFVNIKTVYIH